MIYLYRLMEMGR